ncbi:hypothetical protein GQ473_03540 [archaeon]|nr:hypothetical protein [archaeon]
MNNKHETPEILYKKNASTLDELKLYDLFKDDIFKAQYQEIKNSSSMKQIKKEIHTKIIKNKSVENASDIVDVFIRYHIHETFYEQSEQKIENTQQTYTIKQIKENYPTASSSGQSELLNVYSIIKQIEGSAPIYVPSKVVTTTGTTVEEQQTPTCFGIYIPAEYLYERVDGKLIILDTINIHTICGCVSRDRDDPKEISKISAYYISEKSKEESTKTINDLCTHIYDGECAFRTNTEVNINTNLTDIELHEIVKSKVLMLTERYSEECKDIKSITNKKIKELIKIDDSDHYIH